MCGFLYYGINRKVILKVNKIKQRQHFFQNIIELQNSKYFWNNFYANLSSKILILRLSHLEYFRSCRLLYAYHHILHSPRHHTVRYRLCIPGNYLKSENAKLGNIFYFFS